MPQILITGNVLGRGFCRVLVRSDRIAHVQRLGPERAGERYCSPGFIDVQINGFGGVDFSRPDLTPEIAAGLLPALWGTGTTSFCPTLVTSPLEVLDHSLRVLEDTRRKYTEFATSVPCYHLEGPYLSPGASHGAHDPNLMRLPNCDEFERLQQAAGQRIGLLTIAPELPGSLDLIHYASRSGVVVGIGHTDGAAEDIYDAVRAGARLSTHLGNGCPEFIHRHKSPIWAQLVSDDLWASMICDGFHLPAELVQAITRFKGPDRCILVTDAVHVAGLAPGKYHLGSNPIELLPDGKVITCGAPFSMAGSTLTMNRAVERYKAMARVSLSAAIRASTLNPAGLLGRKTLCGEIAEGAPANLAIWRWENDSIEIETVFVSGSPRSPQ